MNDVASRKYAGLTEESLAFSEHKSSRGKATKIPRCREANENNRAQEDEDEDEEVDVNEDKRQRERIRLAESWGRTIVVKQTMMLVSEPITSLSSKQT